MAEIYRVNTPKEALELAVKLKKSKKYDLFRGTKGSIHKVGYVLQKDKMPLKSFLLLSYFYPITR